MTEKFKPVHPIYAVATGTGFAIRDAKHRCLGTLRLRDYVDDPEHSIAAIVCEKMSPVKPTEGDMTCTCHRCIEENDIRSPCAPELRLNVTQMILCEICGNKRCPHASDHRLGCTGSNESGQPGSIYQKWGPE